MFHCEAAYGNHLAPEVVTLREFRDDVLLTTGLGHTFVEGYYRVSPSLAAFIAEHSLLEIAVRWGLTPIVYAVKHPLAVFALVVAIPAAVIARKRRAASRQWQVWQARETAADLFPRDYLPGDILSGIGVSGGSPSKVRRTFAADGTLNFVALYST